MNYGQGHGLGINDFGYGYRGSPMPVSLNYSRNNS